MFFLKYKIEQATKIGLTTNQRMTGANSQDYILNLCISLLCCLPLVDNIT